MSVKNATAKTWTIIASFDGLKYSAWPAGDKPAGYQTSPVLVGTDIRAITLVNNYNGNGSWFKVMGYSLGTAAALGTTAGARVFLRDPLGDNAWHEVSNYLSLTTARTYARNQLQRLTVQVGALGGSQTSGRSLDLKVTVNGVDTNVLTGRMINQGARDFYFASPVGSDSTGVKNDPTHPYRYVQNASGGTYLGIWAAWQPGDTIVIRGNGGTWTDQLAACNTRWAQFPWGPAFAVTTGSVPTGSAGTGYYTFYGYPGEDVHGSFNTGGGIQGPDSARAQTGNGQYVQIAGLRMDIQGGAARDAGPINLQNGALGWICNDNECGPWVAGASSVLNSSAIGGQGNSCEIRYNYVHDIAGLSDLQNHGMYFGGVAGGTGYNNASTNMDVGYNWIQNATGGSGIQLYWQVGSNSNYLTGNKVHHNFVESTAKYGINVGESCVSADVYDNIVALAGWSAFRICPPSGQTPAINFEHNTAYAWNQVHGATTQVAAILNEGYITTGSVKFNHNALVAAARAGAYSIDWYANNGAGDTNLAASQNDYWDPDGVKTTGWSIDAAAIFSDPKFSNAAALNFTPLTGSPLIDAVTTSASVSVSDDFYGIARPQGAHNDIGACEGVGT